MTIPIPNLVKAVLALRDQATAAAQERSSLLGADFARRYNILIQAMSEHVRLEVPPLPEAPVYVTDLVGAIDFAVTAAGLSASGAATDAADGRASGTQPKPATPKKPRVFFGCSVEGVPYASILQMHMQYKTEVTIWNQGVFGLSRGTLESLVAETSNFDYAVLVLTPDDLRNKRDETGRVARDNVIFELGLFMGALGREHVFMVVQKGVSLPTDLAGITPAWFDAPEDAQLESALGPVATQLLLAMNALR